MPNKLTKLSKIDEIFQGKKYFYAAGRRKRATAQVRLYPEGKGRIYINQKEYRRYFPNFEFQKILAKPLDLIKERQSLDLSIKIQGGGMRGQAEAAMLAVSRSLAKSNPEIQDKLKKSGFLTRDPREKERKKPGLKRARRAPQWSKR
jgi:small subunit ribosomal protein S9